MPGRVSSTNLVGRGHALDALRSALVSARRARPAIVLVSGEAGIGKTRLVREAARRARAGRARVLWGECPAVGGGELPYAPIIGALRPLARGHGADRGALPDASRGEAARLLTALRGGGAPGWPTPESPARLFELVLGTLERLGERAPVMLVVEDAQWADSATERLLAFLVRNLRDARLMVLVTWRRDEPDVRRSLRRTAAELMRDARVERVELQRLSRDETAAQVAGILAAPADPSLVDWAYARSGGNPYLTEELVAVRAGGLDGQVPESLRDVLLARIAVASGSEQRILRLVAVVGGPAEHALVARAVGLDDATLAADLHHLLDEHVLVRHGDGSQYAFRHALAREAVYAELLAPERESLHADLARQLEAAVPSPGRGAVEWSALAHHWHAAGKSGKALAAAIAAGEAAVAVYAFGDAQRQLERALALWSDVPAAERPVGIDDSELLCRLADATRLDGRWEDAMPIAECALDALPPEADGRRQARVELLLSTLHREPEAATAHARRALEALGPGPSAERSAAMLRLASAATYGELPSVARVRGTAALAAAEQAGANGDAGAAHRIIGSSLVWAGRIDEGLEHLHAAHRVAVLHGRAEDHVRAVDQLGAALIMLARLEDALAAYDGAMDRIREAGMVRSHGIWLEANAAECEVRLGRWGRACERLARLLSLRVNGDDVRLAVLAATLVLAARRGEEADTAEREAEALALLQANVSRGAAAVGYSALAELALARGRPQRARQLVAAAREQLRYGDLLYWTWMLCLGLRAEADLAALCPSDAREPARARARALRDETHWYAFEEPTDVRAPPETLIHWDVADAELARLDDAWRPDAWADIARRWDAIGQPYQGVYARLREAEARLALDQRAPGAEALRDAHATASRLGARPIRRELTSMARRAGIAVADAGGSSRPFDLTARELTVLELMARGRTNRQIAEALFVSTRTVDVHVRHVLAKMNAANRVEAAGMAHRVGIATPSDRPAVKDTQGC